MKLDFEYKNDYKLHEYCIECHRESALAIIQNKRTYYTCSNCNTTSERRIVIDPKIDWWVTPTNEYWHSASGVFIRNTLGQFLFFERNKFPFAFTVPAGHINVGEEPIDAARREVLEEVGLEVNNLVLIAQEDIPGEQCGRGSDSHRWYAYLHKLENNVDIVVKEEGDNPVWQTLDEVIGLGKDYMTLSNRKIVLKYKKLLLQ